MFPLSQKHQQKDAKRIEMFQIELWSENEILGHPVQTGGKPAWIGHCAPVCDSCKLLAAAYYVLVM